MNYKKLEKATRILAQIKELDQSIIQIDRIALIIANGGGNSSFTLSVQEHKKAEDDKVKFDEDGSLTQGIDSYTSMIRKYVMWYDPVSQPADNHTSNTHNLNMALSENATLQILGVLLGEKHRQRDLLMGELARLGVKTA